MNIPDDSLGSYEKFVSEDGSMIPVDGIDIDSLVSKILRSNDYVLEHACLCRFVKKYFMELTASQRDCVLLASALITINSKTEGSYTDLLGDVLSKYRQHLESQTDEKDLNHLFIAIRLVAEIGGCLDQLVIILAELLENISLSLKTEEIKDALNIIVNHADVLKFLYDGRLDASLEERIDKAVHTINR